MDTLHFTMKVDVQDALDNAAMAVFTSLLGHDNEAIRYKAARDIMDLRSRTFTVSFLDRLTECNFSVRVGLLYMFCRPKIK